MKYKKKYKNLFNLDGKVAVVTGGAGLIGKGLVSGLTEAGADVVAADVNKTDPDAAFKRTDITKEKSVSDLINYVSKKYGRIDIWINAAYPKTSDWGARFEKICLASWRKNIDMHLGGYFICCQKAAEYMKKKKSGSIINLASIYGITAPHFSIYEGTNMTMPAAYSVIKAGIIAFSKYLAAYYAKFTVRVNCVSPGGVYNGQPASFVKRYIERTPLGRMAESEDIIKAVIYLASDASLYITGQNLVVDGGFSIV